MNIILAHGILGFRKFLDVEYFNGVKEHLENSYPCNVLVTQVDPTAGVEERGKQLRQQIIDALKADHLSQGVPTHIIAHSMGGLDSRFILSPSNPDNIAEYITSLTTIGTPHLGSPIADVLYPWANGESPLVIAELVENWGQKFLNEFGISLDGLQDLTTQCSKVFDQNTTDHANVKYFWTAGIGRSGIAKTSALLLASYEYMKLNNGEENDGAVPISSARHGTEIGVPWFADHLDEVGHDLNNLPNGAPPDFDYLAKYDEIIATVSL
jgi:triacylglycerol lipase